MAIYETIVIGLGGIGSAALYHLAAKGVRAVGIDQFGIAHDRGSSHGETRLIRRAYFEHPDYVPLVDNAFDAWRTIERETHTKLFSRTGLLLVGPDDGPTIAGARRAAATHDVNIESLTASDIESTRPGFAPPAESAILFEPDAGTLAVEACVRVCIESAKHRGSTVRIGERVLRWSASRRGVTVETDANAYQAASLIITAGGWAPEMLGSLHLPLTLRRQPLVWFASRDPSYRRDRGCPVFGFEIDDHFLYGFPSTDGETVKMGDHTDGVVCESADEIDRTLRPDDLARLTPFVASCLPGVEPRVVKHTVCFYTMTPDQHFIVDRHPEHANVAFAAGLSGHGFKFAPVLGLALVDLVLTGHTAEPIGFLSASRRGCE